MIEKLKKGAYFTDIHFGRRSNSEDHNKDCINYIEWFIEQIRKDQSINHIVFLGDWHEHRSAIDSTTLKYSYEGAKMLNSLGLPFYVITGNHDCGRRSSRDIFTTNHFEPFKNIILVNKPIIKESVSGAVLFCPYLFHHEYDILLKYNNIPIILSHLELNGFILTGEHNIATHGLDHKEFFKNQKRVFSGHFHKRQEKDNIHYIGNTFPMDFSDANDNDRGMAIYDYENDKLEYKNWSECPKYINCKLSEVLENNSILLKGSRVNCTVDVEISYSESIELKNILTDTYKLRELFFNETDEKHDVLENTSINEEKLDTQSTHELIKSMLMQIVSDKMDKELLVKIYEGIK